MEPACDPQADLLVRRARETYRVSGSDLEEILASMGPRRPQDSDGNSWDAVTNWEIYWTYPFIERLAGCSIGREQVAVDIRMVLPQWDAPADADPAVVTGWARYLNALERHEENHARIALAAACEVRQALRALESESDCEALERSADTATQAVIDRYRALEERYDQETLHGATEDAILE